VERGRRVKATSAMGVAIAAIVVAGCSSSSHPSQSSATTATGGQTGATAPANAQSSSCTSSPGARGVTGSEITVKGLVTVLDFGTGASAAAKARFDEANADGEIPCGRKINYLGYADDGGTPDQNLAQARRMVEEDHVFAVVPALSPFTESGGVYMSQQHLPSVGWGLTPNFCASSASDYSSIWAFGFNGCIVPQVPNYETPILGAVLTKFYNGATQGKPAAVIGDDSDSTKRGNVTIAAQFVADGFDLVYNQNPMPGPPTPLSDATPYVVALMTADHGKPPDIIYITSGPLAAFPLAKALRQAGYKGVIMHSTYAPQLAGAAATQYVINNFATAESKTPEMTKILGTLKAAGVTNIGQPELAGYYSADMFVQILKKVGADLTPQRFQQVASSFTYEIPTAIGPTYYPAGFQAGPPCGELVYSNGTAWSQAVPYVCGTTDLKNENGKYVSVPYPSGIN
jgi:branched-chain amino acid transport system substrate-binding protein